MLKSIPSKSVDLVVTSPPYDNLRTYGGVVDSWNFDKFKAIANELARVLKDGGVIVWNVCDQCVNGSYTCNSYRQVLYFTEKLGLKLNDEIVWHKSNPMMNNRRKRYQAAHELLYVFTKGKLETFNPIMRECKNGGKQYKKTFISNTGKGYTSYKEGLTNKEAVDYNVWTIPTATSKESTYISKEGCKIHHTAVFPKELAERVVMTWSNEGDTVLDPFLGSGTSGIAAVELGRSFIGCELNEDYFTMASERIQERMNKVGYVERNDYVNASQKSSKQLLQPSDILSDRLLMKVVDKKGKKHNLYFQRVECAVYEKLGFSRYDYVGGKPINKAAMCFLVTTSKGQTLGFLGFLNHTFKGCSNGMKVSRFVLSPQFRGKGLALPILSRTCGILKSKGYRVFINTESHKLGGRLMASCNYRSTTFNCVNRAIRKDDRYKGRRSGKAYRLEYCGNSVYGYGIMLGKLADMRARNLNCRVKRKQPFTPTSHNHLTFYGYSVVQLYVDSRNGMCSESHIACCQTPQYLSRGSPFGMSGWGLNVVNPFHPQSHSKQKQYVQNDISTWVCV